MYNITTSSIPYCNSQVYWFSQAAYPATYSRACKESFDESMRLRPTLLQFIHIVMRVDSRAIDAKQVPKDTFEEREAKIFKVL